MVVDLDLAQAAVDQLAADADDDGAGELPSDAAELTFEDLGIDPDAFAAEVADAAEDIAHIETAAFGPIVEERRSGYRLTFDQATFAEVAEVFAALEEGDDGDTAMFRLTRTPSSHRLDGTLLDAADDMLTGAFDLSLSFTFSGDVTATNGTVSDDDARTVTFTEPGSINATA